MKIIIILAGIMISMNAFATICENSFDSVNNEPICEVVRQLRDLNNKIDDTNRILKDTNKKLDDENQKLDNIKSKMDDIESKIENK